MNTEKPDNSIILQDEVMQLREKTTSLELEILQLKAALNKAQETIIASETEYTKSQKLIESVFNSVPGMIYLYDENGRLINWNKRFEYLTGYNANELAGRYILDWFSENPESMKNINLGLNKMALTGYGEAEALLRRKNGIMVPMFFTATPLQWEDKEYITGIGLDISEQRKAFEMLNESEKKYRSLFNNTSNGFALHEIITDENGKAIDYRFLEVNPAFEKLTGLKANDIVGKTCLEVLPDTEPYWIEMYSKVAQTGQSVSFENFSSALDRHYQVSAYSNEKGKFATYFLDITERKEMEIKLRDSEEKYRAIYDNSTDAILVVNAEDFRIIDVNETTLKLFDYQKKEELIHNSVFDLSALQSKNDIAETEMYFKHTISKGDQSFECMCLRSNGSTFSSDIKLKKIVIDQKIKILVVVRDTTFQKSVEQTIRNNARLLDDIMQNSDSLIYILDNQQRFIAVNNKYAAQFGKTPAELTGKSRLDIMPVHLAIESENNDKQVWNSRKAITFDESQHMEDGTHYYFSVKFPLFDKDQNIYGIAGISSDITQMRKAIDELSASEKKFESLFDDHAAVKMLIDSETGRITDANKSAAKYYGWTKEELCGMHITQINMLPQEEIKARMDEVFDENRRSFTFKHRHKDGSVTDVEVFSSTLLINGRLHHHSIVMDITKKVQAEKALKLSEEKFSKAFRSSPDLILMTEYETGKIVDVNDNVTAQTGYTYDEVIGHTTLELKYWYNDDDRLRFIETLNKTGNVQNMEALLKLKSGELRHHLISAETIDFQGEKYILGVNRDITEKKKTEEQLKTNYALIRVAGENARLGGWSYRIGNEHVTWSDVVCEIHGKEHGYSPLLEEGINFYAKEYIDTITNSFNACLHSGIPYDLELQIINNSGERVWVRVTGETNYNEKTEIIGVSGSFQDINERKIAEENYRKSREMFRLIFDQSPFGISLVDTKTGINIETNNKFAEITGRSREVLTRTSWMEITHPDDLDADNNLMNELIEGKRDFFSMKKRYLKPDGSPVWVKMSVVLIKIDEQETGHHLCMIEDIGEQVKAEEALQESELNFRSLFEKGPIGIAYHKMIYNQDGEPTDYLFLEANSSYQELTGVNPVGMKASEAFPGIQNDPSDWIGKFGKVAKTGKEIRFQQYLEANDRWYDCVAYQYKPDHFVAAFLEITLQKRTEIALIESQKLYHSFVEHIPGSVFRKDADGRYIFVNNIFCKMKRLKAEEIIGKTTNELYEYEITKDRKISEMNDFFQSTLPEGEDHHQQIMRTGEPIEIEEVYNLPDGTRKYYQVVKSPVFGFGNRVVGSQGIQFDITDRKLAETALLKKERQLQTMISNLPGFVYRCAYDKDWTMHFLSEGITSITGYKPEQLLQNKELAFNEIIHPEDQPRINTQWEQVVPEQKVFTEEYRIIDIHGDVRWVWEQGRPVTDPDTNITYLEGFITDITDRKNAQEALLASEEKFRTLFNEMNDVVSIHSLVYDNEGKVIDFRITDCNPAFCELVHLSRAEIIGKSGTEIYKFEKIPHLDKFISVANEGTGFEFSDDITFPNKIFRLSVVSPGNGTFAVLATDLTDISNYNKKLEDKNKELESYVYITSHDLRSPLVNIQGFSSRLKKQTEQIQHILKDSMTDDERKKLLHEQLSEKIPLSLDYIFNNVVKMDRMLNGLLQISRTGRLPMQIQKTDVDKLIHNIRKSFNHEISEKNANIEVEKLPACYGDENMLNQLFSNIIGNALKYNAKDRQLLIHISGQQMQNSTLYCIADNGIGISETYLDKIWNVFFRVDYKSQSGEGIGLSVVKRIIEKHKGNIRVASQENLGTKFFIELPNQIFSE